MDLCKKKSIIAKSPWNLLITPIIGKRTGMTKAVKNITTLGIN